MKIALIGCGFVADHYMATLALHPELEVVGVYDRDEARCAAFARYHSVRTYRSLQEVVADPSVGVVVNLTSPESHYEVSRECVLGHKHVYSEKPLALDLAQARQLVQLSKTMGVQLSGAPCTLMGETAQTIWKALRDGLCGKILLAYAEMDEGLLPLAPYKKWSSPSGAAWPSKSEFETGCTIEHAGYCLTWLAAFFGPAVEVQSFAATLFPGKEDASPAAGPDFSVACIRFESGVVARMTNSIVAPHDHGFTLIGDRGILQTPESWSFEAPTYFRRWLRIRRRQLLNPLRKTLRPVRSGVGRVPSGGAQRIDFARGISSMAQAIRSGVECYLTADFVLHTTELALAISQSSTQAQPYKVQTRFSPVHPLPWAC